MDIARVLPSVLQGRDVQLNTIYLLDALFLMVAGTAAIFAFGVTTSRFTGASKMIFFLFFTLFLFTLVLGYLPQTRPVYETEEARHEAR